MSSETTKTKTLVHSLLNDSDKEDSDSVLISSGSDSDANDDATVDANKEVSSDSNDDDGEWHHLRAEMRDGDDNDLEALPLIMRKLEEAKRKKHKMLSEYNKQNMEAAADEFAILAATPRERGKKVSGTTKKAAFAFLSKVRKPEILNIAKTATDAFLSTLHTSLSSSSDSDSDDDADVEDNSVKELQIDEKISLRLSDTSAVGDASPITLAVKEAILSGKVVANTEEADISSELTFTPRDKESEDEILAEFEFEELKHKLSDPMLRPERSVTQALEELSEAATVAKINGNVSKPLQLQSNQVDKSEINIMQSDLNTQVAPSKEETELHDSTEAVLKEDTIATEKSNLERDKQRAKESIENLAGAIAYAEGVENRAAHEIELEKQHEADMKIQLESTQEVEHERLKARLRHKAELKKKKVVTEKAKSEEAKKDIEALDARVQHEFDLEKEHEHEIEEQLEHVHDNEHLRLRSRIRRRTELKREAAARRKQRQEKALAEASLGSPPSNDEIQSLKRKINSLEQDIISSAAVRRRLEQELSTLRSDSQPATTLEMQQTKDKLEDFQVKARKYQDELNALREKTAQEVEERQREKNTWKLRLRAAEKNHENRIQLMEADMEMQIETFDHEKGSLHRQIEQLTSTVHRLKEESSQEGRMSAQIARAKRALQQQRRIRGAAYAIVHTGANSSELLDFTEAQTSRERVARPTHIIQQNVIFELSETPMLEETVDADLTGDTNNYSGLPKLRHAALLCGQGIHIRQMFGGWACLQAPFPGSWINLRVLGKEGIVPADSTEFNGQKAGSHSPDQFSATVKMRPHESRSHSSTLTSPMLHGSPTSTPKQLNFGTSAELRDQTAAAIHQVQELEELVWRGQRMLAQTRLKSAAFLHHTVRRTESDMERQAQHWKRMMNNLSALFEEFAVNAHASEEDKASDEDAWEYEDDPTTGDVSPGSIRARAKKEKRKRRKRKSGRLKRGGAQKRQLPTVRAAVGSASLSQHIGLGGVSSTFGDSSGSSRSSWLQTQEQGGVWALPPSRLARRSLRAEAKRTKASRKLLKLFAKLQAAASKSAANGTKLVSQSEDGPRLTWVRSVLPKRVFYVYSKYAKASKSTLAKLRTESSKSPGANAREFSRKDMGSFKQGIKGASIIVYRFPLDAESHDLEDGTVIFDGWTGSDGRVVCRVSPGCYMIEVKTLPEHLGSSPPPRGDQIVRSSRLGKSRKKLIMIDPARGHMDKGMVEVPIEVPADHGEVHPHT